MNSVEINHLYHEIKTGLSAGLDQRLYIAHSSSKIAQVSASSMADIINRSDLAPQIEEELLHVGRVYLDPIYQFASGDGNFASAQTDVILSGELIKTVNSIAKVNISELPRVLNGAKISLSEPPLKVVRHLPFRLIEKMASDVVVDDDGQSTSSSIFRDAAMDKIGGYGEQYLLKFFSAYLRMLEANAEQKNYTHEELNAGMVAILLANYTWQTRRVVLHTLEFAKNGTSSLLKNRQFTSFQEMLSNVYEDNQKHGLDRARAATEVVIVQDIAEYSY